MTEVKRLLASLSVAALLSACGGDNAPPPPPRNAAAQTGKAGPAASGASGAKVAAKKPVKVDTALAAEDSTELQREVFSYRGAGRDPFFSLLKSADTHPLVSDVRVAGITYDPAYPARSVAVLRDTAQKKRYAVRQGDELGRMKVTEIRPDQVVVTLEEFGVERQVVLPMKRRQEETP